MTKKTFDEASIREMDLEEVSASEWRHGRRAVFVFEDDGAHWRFTAEVHHDEGLQLYGGVECTQVHQVDRIVKVWVPTP